MFPLSCNSASELLHNADLAMYHAKSKADGNYQFYSKIPYEGHHREYTLEEMEWMLKQFDIKDINLKMFDYNLFQFEKIEDDHLEAFLEMICNFINSLRIFRP